MERDGIIQKSNTHYISPLIIVKKADNSIRLCLDARRINEISKPKYEAPQHVNILLTKIGKSTIFTKLDLKNSFWLIPLSPESRKYTGFQVDGQVYEFLTVPFGLQSSSSALVRALREVLEPYQEFCISYIDDILIISNSPQEHLKDIEKIVNILNKFGLKLNIDKCVFYQSEVQYLGFKITNNGITIDEKRLEQIQEFPKPKNLKTLRGFLGMINYYSKFVPNLAEKERPLIELLKKNEKWIWDERRIKAFNQIKNEFYKNISVYVPNFKEPFLLRTDASEYSIGGELVQMQRKEEVPICFVSRMLRGPEVRYSVGEKEMLAIVYCCQKLGYWLRGNKFTIETDHKALSFMRITKYGNSRIYRWNLLLQEYDFEIKYRPGCINFKADFLSRKDTEKTKKTTELLIAHNKINTVLMGLNQLKHETGVYSKRTIIESQENLGEVKNKVQEKMCYRGIKLVEGYLVKVIKNQELYVLDEETAERVLKEIHQDYGHVGVRKTWMIFRENYFSMHDLTSTKRICQNCQVCMRTKYRNYHNLHTVHSISVNKPLELITIDYLSNLIISYNGNKNILVIYDLFSKYVKLYPTVKCNRKETTFRNVYK